MKEIFAAVVDLDDEARRAKLESMCAGDDGVRRQVDILLRSNGEAGNLLEQPAFKITDAVSMENEPTANKHIGNYRVIREIGRGGMGTVFLAARDDGHFSHQAAIKVVSSAFLGRESLDRFRRERQILAGLNHPNIARLLDGGVTAEGLPYLVMEYVEGDTLVEHAERHALDIDDRLRLFVKICRAFAYAHGNLVVHRDIKPSNIVVTADGEPKLLDFGLAKFLDIDSDGIRTATNFRALTPAYASPEQVRGETITTASDIYSLGVVLYELLTGSRPFETRSSSLGTMARVRLTAPPDKPSSKQRAVSLGPGRAARRLGSHRPAIGRDLDNIVLMAMRIEPERRYRSVEQFADDIERHLNGLPITATEDTFAYRASKFFQRHKTGTVAATLVVLVVIAAFAATSYEARVAARERDQAQLERDKAEQLNDFLQSVLSAASPEEKGKNAKVIEVLDDAAARIETELADQPELRARALTTIGRTYNAMGLPDAAEPKLRTARTIYAELLPEANRDKTRNMLYLAESLTGQYKFDEAEPLLREVIATERAFGAAGNKDLSEALFVHGELSVRQARFADAERFLNESISICDSLPTGSEFDCAYYRIALGRAKQFSGDLDAAEAMFRQSLAVFHRQPSRYAVRIADISVNLGNGLLAKNDHAGSIVPLTEADQIYQKLLGDSLNLVISRFYLSRAYLGQGDNTKALDHARSAVQIARRLGWVDNRDFIGALRVMGLSESRLGNPRAGETYLREALERAKSHLRSDDARTQDVQSSLGECLTALGRFAEAESLLLDAAATQKAGAATESAFLETRKRLSALYRKWKRPDDARKYE